MLYPRPGQPVAVTRRTNGGNLRTFQKESSFGIREALDTRLPSLFKSLKCPCNSGCPSPVDRFIAPTVEYFAGQLLSFMVG
jgi:hypothetical protein